MKKLRKFTSLMLAFGLAMGLTSMTLRANGEHEEAAKPHRVEDAEEISLSEWEGEFNSPIAYFEDEAVKESMKQLAEKMGKSADEVSHEWEEMMKSDFKALKVEGDKITFFDGKIGEGKEITSAEYAYDSTYATKHGNFDLEWFAFRAKNDDAQYPVLLLMPLHGEEVLMHFHMRYGSDIDSLFENENWWPTFMKSDTTTEQVVEMIESHANHDEDAEEAEKSEGKEEHELPAPEVLEDVNLKEWDGFWNNMGAYLKSDELKSAFETLAQNEGKSVEEARIAYKLKRAAAFDGIEFNGEEGTIAFYDGFKDDANVDPLSKAHYSYKESYKVKHGNFDLEWHVFTTEDEGALYPVVVLMGVHGEEVLTHFHMRYGDDAVELLKKDGWFPTFVKPESTFDQLAAEITE
ncbi:MAG: ZinT/AdcA family metal-binding protein [Eubacteriales bacterium]|nr:ZinT/AdcA family metal-binding protein [Eubacteriales bacterium]